MSLILIFTTYPLKEQAKEISEILIERKLGACCQIKELDSCYFYEDALNQEREFELKVITTKKNRESCVQLIKRSHPYQVPKILWTEIESSDDYEQWVMNSCWEKEIL